MAVRHLGSQATHLWPRCPSPRASKGSIKSLSVCPKLKIKDSINWALPGEGKKARARSLYTQSAACELCVAPGAHCPPSEPHRYLLSSAFYEKLLPVPKQSSGTHSQGLGCCPILRVCSKAQCRSQPSQTPPSMQNVYNQECPSKICKQNARQGLSGFSQNPCGGLLGSCRHLTTLQCIRTIHIHRPM